MEGVLDAAPALAMRYCCLHRQYICVSVGRDITAMQGLLGPEIFARERAPGQETAYRSGWTIRSFGSIVTILKLPRFGGHRTIWDRGVHDGQDKRRIRTYSKFRRQMVELVHAGRSPEDLAGEFEPTARSIRNVNGI
jgi:hypothetical protein